jgi:hypothetical protein
VADLPLFRGLPPAFLTFRLPPLNPSCRNPVSVIRPTGRDRQQVMPFQAAGMRTTRVGADHPGIGFTATQSGIARCFDDLARAFAGDVQG